MLVPPNIVILCYVNAHPLKYVQFPWLPYEGHAGHPVWPFLLRGFPDALQAPA